ncbi:hypothetical protein [Bacteroides acidifaciens]|uniref:hypothetical protein n=3 Tax=Bacteroides acidifaciens TaxID=85831 RepID=UPI00258C5EF7|nr:hypothetical protein [Bacteroides acidifaciens]
MMRGAYASPTYPIASFVWLTYWMMAFVVGMESLLAILFALPFGLSVSIYVSEVANPKVRNGYGSAVAVGLRHSIGTLPSV